MGQRRLGAARAAVERRLDGLFGTGWTPPSPAGGMGELDRGRTDGDRSDGGRTDGGRRDADRSDGGRSDAGGAAHDSSDGGQVRRWRIDPGRRAAAAMVAAVAATALLVGWRVLADRPQAHALADSSAVHISVPEHGSGAQATVTPVTPGATQATARGSTPPVPPGASGSPSPIVVDVVGKVRRPGIVTLPAGARVNDAVRSAGGALPGTNLAAVNLARLCVDGEQIAIGRSGAATVAPAASGPESAAPGASGPVGSAGGLVNLNTASTEQLDSLPGVGPVMAQRILDWRTTHGAFQSVDQLKQVSGIGDAKYADISPLVTV